MKDNSSQSLLRSDLKFLAMIAALTIAALVFRENLGILAAATLGLATLVQLFRTIFLHGNAATLKNFWKEFLNALSGLV